MFIRATLAMFLLCAWGCGESAANVDTDASVPDGSIPDGSAPDGGVGSTPVIVDADWLKGRLGDPSIQLVDTRSVGYGDSRIPGAIPLVPVELTATVDGIGAQIAPPDVAEIELREAGLRNGVTAVVYGTGPEYDPARIVWALRYYQHGEVLYLDGGFAGWVASGGEVDSDPPEVASSDYVVRDVDDDLRVTGAYILEQLGEPPFGSPAVQLVDARSEGEYAGGRIPGALSVNWVRNLDAGFLIPETELDALYAGLDPSTTTVTYCLSGWRGAFAWLTLTALGYEDVRLYDGSWNEWGNGEFPVEP